ncbi:MAG: c-type cytochrome [Gammaproteobacteria bacterium]|nr:c-type cytochrome [Gammaproteobacteria bacterium]
MIRNTVATLALTLLLTLHSQACLADDPVIPDDKFVYCTVCHGMQLRGIEQLQAPRLSGMDAWYVRKQLDAFSKNWRGAHAKDYAGMEMRPMAAILSAPEIAEAADFVSKTRSPMPEATVAGDAVRGEKLYTSCGVCHGTRAEGNEGLGAPALVGGSDWYLARQIRNFRDGIRGASPADMYGVQMRAAASVLPDDDAVDDIVAYLNTLQPE